jgi:uncharacterized membrane protein
MKTPITASIEDSETNAQYLKLTNHRRWRRTLRIIVQVLAVGMVISFIIITIKHEMTIRYNTKRIDKMVEKIDKFIEAYEK